MGLGLPEVIVEHDGGDVTRYLHLPHGIATDDGAWTYNASDGLGSVRQRLDESGQVAAVNGYRPFGSPLEGDGGEPYGFTGEWWEGDAGLLFLRARYYDPQLGIFLSPDPVPGTHLYLYVNANPINLVDPSGMCPPGDPRCTPSPPTSTPTPPRPPTPLAPTPTPTSVPSSTPVPQPQYDPWALYDPAFWASSFEYDVARRFDPFFGNQFFYDPPSNAVLNSQFSRSYPQRAIPSDYLFNWQYSLWRSLPHCTKCHIIHPDNRVPTNAELDPYMIDYWHSLDRYRLSLYFMLIGSLCNSMTLAEMLAAENTVTIYAFRGTGFRDAAYASEHALIRAGHVGVSFDGGQIIYGFHPSGAAMTEFGDDALLLLKEHVAMQGQVYNDTAVFIRAQELAVQGAQTQVYALPMTVSAEEYAAMQASVFAQAENPSLTQSWYSFPYRAPDGAPLPMPLQCNNCATWPRTLGLPIPEETGQLKFYIEALCRAGGMPWCP